MRGGGGWPFIINNILLNVLLTLYSNYSLMYCQLSVTFFNYSTYYMLINGLLYNNRQHVKKALLQSIYSWILVPYENVLKKFLLI